MNVDVPVSDVRCIHVVANGLPLWRGAQLALDATLVSPVMRAGEPQPGSWPSRPLPAESGAKPIPRARERAGRVSSSSGSRKQAGALELKQPPSGTLRGTVLLACRRRSGPLPAQAGSSAGLAGILDVAAMRAFAASLLELRLAVTSMTRERRWTFTRSSPKSVAAPRSSQVACRRAMSRLQSAA